ncbi:MAG: 3'-5' exonuclease [Flavobacterium sp.]
MPTKTPLENILFLDIETVPLYEDFSQLPEIEKEYFDSKTKYQRGETLTEDFYQKAGIWAEFGKIVCISVGYFHLNKDIRQLRIKSFVGDEKQLLKDFCNLLNNHFSAPQYLLCGHNAKEFDFPYISRRLIINGLPLPNKLNLFGKKPWEISHIDTLELWKFGDYKHFTSLKLMAHVLGISSPKDDIDGSQVAMVYYKEKDIDRIVIYCQKDVVTTAQIFLRLGGNELLIEDEILFI